MATASAIEIKRSEEAGRMADELAAIRSQLEAQGAQLATALELLAALANPDPVGGAPPPDDAPKPKPGRA